MTVTDPVTVGHRLGYLLSTPQYSVLALDIQIQSLKSMADGPESQATITRLARLASSVRSVELRSLREAVAELSALGAPPGSYADLVLAIDELVRPLDTTAVSAASKETDPATLAVLATLEESDRLIPKSWARIMIWLKVANGQDGLWGYRLGRLASSLKLAGISSPNVADLGLVRDLRNTMPKKAPRNVRDALDKLDSQMKRKEVNFERLGDAEKAIASSYPCPLY
jgi:hypothetical protein